MTIKQIAALIESKGYLFQVKIPGTSFSHGRTSISNALADCPSLEEYIQHIAIANRAKQMIVELYTPNGSSVKRRGEHIVFADDAIAVATTLPPATPVATLSGTNEPPANTPHMNMSINDQINHGILKVEHRMVCQQRDDLAERVKELSKKVDLLQEEKLALVKENSVNKEKNDIELERHKLAAERADKNSLNGLIGELKDPETLKMIMGLLKPDHPMFRQGISGTGAPATELIYHDDPEANIVLKAMPELVKTFSTHQIAHVYAILTALAGNRDKIAEVMTLLNINH